MTFNGILTTNKTEPQKSYLNYMHIPSFILGLKCLVSAYLISNSLGDENKATSSGGLFNQFKKYLHLKITIKN